MTQYFTKIENRLAKYKLRYQQHPKKAAIKFIWWNLCYLFSVRKYKFSFTDDKQHIAIVFAGGIGDYVISAKYVEALVRYLSNNCIIDIFCEECDIVALQAIFYGKKYVNNILSKKAKYKYDLHIRIVRFPVVLSYIEKRLDEKTIQYVHKLEKFYRENPLIVSNDYMGRCWSLLKRQRRENQADVDNILDMSQSEFKINLPNNEDIVLSKYGLDKQKFITIQTGAGIHFQHIKNETRQWPIEYYCELINILKNEYPQYKIVQLGVEYQSLCSNIDLDLRGKTAVSELFVLLKNAKLHISQEGGMPIIRHFVKGGKSIVLFGPTDEKFFGFSENINISARSCNACCEWLTKDWMEKCPQTEKGNAECMRCLAVNLVAKNIEKELL